MVLNKLESDLFYGLLWTLLDYANDRLHVVECLTDETGAYNPDLGHPVADRVWQDRGIIDDFVRENPACLNKLELGIVAQWKHALHDRFFCLTDDELGTVFMAGKHPIRVCGPTEEVSSLLPRTPTFVNATLVPFGEYVVSCVWVEDYALTFGPSIIKRLEEDCFAAIQRGDVARTGDELIALIPVLEQEREHDRVEREKQEARVAEKGKTRQKGTHRSILAGLAEEARREFVSRELARRAMEQTGRTPADNLARQCVEGAPVFSLATILEGKKKDDLLRLARTYDVKGASSMNKAKLSASIVQGIVDPEGLGIQLGVIRPEELEDVRAVYERGGRMQMNDADVVDLRVLPKPVPPFLHVFHDASVFTFVIPDEVMPALGAIDWDEAMRSCRTFDIAGKYVGLCAELWGIADADTVYSSYVRNVPEELRLPRNDFEFVMLGGIVRPDESTCDYINVGGTLYAADFDAAEWYRQDLEATGDREGAEATFAHGEPVGFVGLLLGDREGIPARDVPFDVLEEASLGEWLVQWPAAVALRDFFDDNVPDDLDDFLFADSAVYEMAYMTLHDYRPQDLLTYVNECGYEPDEARLTKLLDLVTAFYNELPHWRNYGWSPKEFREKGLKRAPMADADAKLRSAFGMIGGDDQVAAPAVSQKVGRNDPCPCGSGKKYKKCCGKPK